MTPGFHVLEPPKTTLVLGFGKHFFLPGDSINPLHFALFAGEKSKLPKVLTYYLPGITSPAPSRVVYRFSGSPSGATLPLPSPPLQQLFMSRHFASLILVVAS